jgi:cystathionine gamma-synthase
MNWPLDTNKNLGFGTQSVHAGEARQKPNDAITDSICCASTFTFESTESILKYLRENQDREEYGRYGNPNEKVVERKLAALEGAEDAIVYSSGMAAVVGLLMCKLSAGEEICLDSVSLPIRSKPEIWRPCKMPSTPRPK